MSLFNRLVAVIVAAAMIAPLAPLQARTRKGDKYYADGRAHEAKKEWDAALESYEKALSEVLLKWLPRAPRSVCG